MRVHVDGARQPVRTHVIARMVIAQRARVVAPLGVAGPALEPRRLEVHPVDLEKHGERA